jgi:hypothetical protein
MTNAPEQTSDPPEDSAASESSLGNTRHAENAEAVLDPDASAEQPEQVAAAEVERHQRRGGGTPS